MVLSHAVDGHGLAPVNKRCYISVVIFLFFWRICEQFETGYESRVIIFLVLGEMLQMFKSKFRQRALQG